VPRHHGTVIRHKGGTELGAAEVASENGASHDQHCTPAPGVGRPLGPLRPGSGHGHSVRMFEAWQREFLEASKVARLSTLTADGAPHLVPVCYALLEDNTIVIAIDEKPKRPGRLARLRHIDRDPRVALLVDRYDDDNWQRLAWVRVDGEAGVVEVAGERPGALGTLRERYEQYRTMSLEERPMIVIKPRRVTGWRASGP
jgi:PPOX class probable F420-dependent enzyme